MGNRIATVISYCFHPLIMPLAGIFIVFNLDTFINYTVSSDAKNTIYGIIFLDTMAIPGFMALYLLRKKIISSLHMPTREERWTPFIMTAGFFYFTYYLIRQIQLPSPVIYSMLLGSTIAITLLVLLNFRWKLSAHMIGIGGIAGGLMGVSEVLQMELLEFMLPVILLAGMVAFARLKLNTHKAWEVYTGFLVGFLCEYFCILFEIG